MAVFAMDAALRTLQRAREDVTSSWEWMEMNREIQRCQYQLGSRNKTTRDAVTKLVESTSAFRHLQARVSYSLHENFLSPLMYHPATASSSLDEPSSHISAACAHLLERSPDLKHHLKKYFNHALPADLRPTAWKLLLSETSDTSLIEYDPISSDRLKDNVRIIEECEAVLKSNPTFASVSHSTVLLQAMAAMVSHWRRTSSSERGREMRSRDMMLCLPFLYVWKERLQRNSSATSSSNTPGKDVLEEITNTYINFMKHLPQAMGSSKSGTTLEAVDQFSLQVEKILTPKLHRHLTKLFNKSSLHGKQSPFHVNLRAIIHSSVQRMFVGDLSLDAVCFIWDQCFIGRLVPGFQCLAYYTSVWLILLSDQLEHSHNIKEATKVLATLSTKLTAMQFQSELEKRFLDKLYRDLGLAAPRLLPVNASLHLNQPPRPRTSPMKRVENTHTVRRYDLQASRTSQHTLAVHDTLAVHEARSTHADKETLEKTVAVLSKRLEEDHKSLTEALKKEQEQHRRDIKVLLLEINALKKKLSTLRSHGPESSPSQTQMDLPILPSHVTDAMSLSTVDARMSPQCHSSGRVSSRWSNIHHQVLPSNRSKISPPSPVDQSLPQLDQDSQSPISYREEARSRPYSSTHLTEKDAMDIWLKILRRFKDGVYLVCHGSEKEKKLLLNNLHEDKYSELAAATSA